MKNFATACASVVNSATMALCALVMMFVFTMTGCDTGNEDDLNYSVGCTDCDDPNTNPDPEKTVVRVDHINGDCPVQNIEWSSKNATLTRGEEYTVAAADGGAYANVLLKYNATIVYSDGTTQMAAPEYNINAAAVAFGYRDTLYVSADNANLFDADPTQETRETSNGTVTFLDWGAGSKIAFLASSSKSVSSLTIAGVAKTDLCDIVVSYEYEGTNVRTVKEEENYIVKVAAISGIVTVDNETRTLTIERPFKVAKEGGSILPPDGDDKEVVDYDVINEKLNGDSWSGDLSEIWSDGSTTTVGTLSYTRSHSFEAPANKEVKVTELSYTKSPASKAENIRTGEVRNDSQYGCTITLTGMKNTLTMKTNRGTMTFAGYWEYPTIILPNGKEFQPQYCAAEIAEKSISDNGISGNRLPINFKANGTYGSESKELSSTLTLVKVENGEIGGGDEDDDFIISAYKENEHEEGGIIKWTLVIVYNKAGETRTAMDISLAAQFGLDSRKATAVRTYNAANPGLTEVRRTSDTEVNYSFDYVEYTSTWTYADFTHEATVSGRENIYYHIDGFDILVWDKKYSVSKVGIEMGVNPIKSTETSETYLDLINYSLFNGSSAIITKSQEVEYTKAIEEDKPVDEVIPNIEKDKVENGNLYYYEVLTHTVNVTENSRTRKSTPIEKAISAIACSDWTATATTTGISLYTTSITYDAARDYSFNSNRGVNTAKASLKTSYPINFYGQTFTLNIAGEVKAEMTRTSSTSTANTYTFTAKLYADGVEVASDSDTCIETIEEEETPDEDEVTYFVEKIGVRADKKLYFNYVEKHSIKTELNKTVEDSRDIIGSTSVVACNDWTVAAGNPTGLTLNASSFSYTSAKDYTFGSNRGNNVVSASLQTEYPITYMGETYTLTVDGTVTGEVNKTASTATSNTYTFTGKLYADGVEIASDSDTAVETIEKEEEPDEPENPEKDYIEATSFDCTVSVTDSGLSGIVIIAHYADGTHVASNGATSTTWGNTLVNGQIGTLETVNHTYSWNKGYAAVPMQAFVYNGYDSPYIGCTPKDNGDGTYTVTSNRGGVSYTFPKRAK